MCGQRQNLLLAVYHGNDCTSLVDSVAIRNQLCSLGAVVYDLKIPDELSRYSAHSLRVSACVALHVAGKTEKFIQNAFCWKSDAFMKYLCNVTVLTIQRNDAITAFDPDGPGHAAGVSIPELQGELPWSTPHPPATKPPS